MQRAAARSGPAADRLLLPVTVAATLASQAIVVAASLVLPLLAGKAAAALGLPSYAVGYYASCVFFASAFASPLAPAFVARYGPIRTHQLMLLLAGIGLAALAAGSLPLLVVGGILVGLGYGPANPASSALLARHSPPRLRARIFSLKQTAVPLGGALAGLLVPTAGARLGWNGAALAVAAVAIAAAILLQPWRLRLDGPAGERAVRLDIDPRRLLGLVRLAVAPGPIRRLSLMALSFAAVQFCFSMLFATVLTTELHWPAASAGAALSAALGVSIVSRILWGWVADRSLARLVLAVMGALMSLACLAAAGMASWHPAAVVGVAVLFGLTAFSWNGIYLAEVARHAPPGRVAEATAATMLFVYAGALAGPALFSTTVSLLGHDAPAFLALAAVGALPCLWLFRPDLAEAPSGPVPARVDRGLP